MRFARRILLWVTCVAVAALLAVNLAYCWHGSLEEMPTEEQQDKVFVVTTAIGLVLVLLEAVLVTFAMRLSRRTQTERSASSLNDKSS